MIYICHIYICQIYMDARYIHDICILYICDIYNMISGCLGIIGISVASGWMLIYTMDTEISQDPWSFRIQVPQISWLRIVC